MKLIVFLILFYVCKVCVLIIEVGCQDELLFYLVKMIFLVMVVDILVVNLIGKIFVLVCEDGLVLYDSCVIM